MQACWTTQGLPPGCRTRRHQTRRSCARWPPWSASPSAWCRWCGCPARSPRSGGAACGVACPPVAGGSSNDCASAIALYHVRPNTSQCWAPVSQTAVVTLMQTSSRLHARAHLRDHEVAGKGVLHDLRRVRVAAAGIAAGCSPYGAHRSMQHHLWQPRRRIRYAPRLRGCRTGVGRDRGHDCQVTISCLPNT
jgi:hypothetical protein